MIYGLNKTIQLYFDCQFSIGNELKGKMENKMS